MQSVVHNIQANGAACQWSADVTEHAHITEIKDPATSGNNQNYESQITRHLDRTDKCRRFTLATALKEASVKFGRGRLDFNAEEHPIFTTVDLLESIDPVSNVSGPTRIVKDYFEWASKLQHATNTLKPPRTFSVPSTAFHFTRDPNIPSVLIAKAAAIFDLNDLRPALGDYLLRTNINLAPPTLTNRRTSRSDCTLPFEKIHVWHRVRMQSRSFYNKSDTLPARVINAHPSNDEWEHGRFDTVLINTDPTRIWPYSGITGE